MIQHKPSFKLFINGQKRCWTIFNTFTQFDIVFKVVSVIVDYKWTLSGVDPESPEYKEKKSQVSHPVHIIIACTTSFVSID